MSKGVPHSPELRAQVVAAVLAGATLAQASRQFGVGKATVLEWTRAARAESEQFEPSNARDPALFLRELLFDLIATNLQTLRVQLQAATRPDWIEKQSAAELAQLVVAERDTLVRLLAGFQSADAQPDQPALDAPEPPETTP
jgi:transposase-like protein